MALRTNERIKLQKTVNDLCNGNFDERHIDTLLMGLRAHCEGFRVFKEVAHFVAHNDIRDQGITTETLEALYLSFRFFLDYLSSKQTLDLSQPFPLYVKKLLKYQIDKCKNSDLTEKFNVSSSRLKSRIDTIFSEDRASKTAQMRSKKISAQKLASIEYLLSFIGVQPAYDQEKIFEEMISVITLNNIDIEVDIFTDQKCRIMLCVLILIHRTNFRFSSSSIGRCEISCDKPSILHSIGGIDRAKLAGLPDETHGTLQIAGFVTLEKDGKELTVAFPVVATTMLATDWCDITMLQLVPPEGGGTDVLFQKINFEADLYINEEFKLCPVAA